MKTQHQIKFKKRPARRRVRQEAKLKQNVERALDISSGQLSIGERELKFARALTDSDKYVRDSSLTSLRSWLSENASGLSELDMDKLWKALFYCIWMADKRPIITATIRNVIELSEITGWKFMHAFFKCMMREWFGIDRHRIDKYYELLNASLNRCVEMVVQQEDDAKFVESLQTLLDLFQNRVYSQSKNGGLGVALHILDSYVDKVMVVVLKRGMKMGGNEVHKVFDKLVAPGLEMLGRTQGHMVAIGKRVQERIMERLIETLKECEIKEKDSRDMIQRVAKRVFQIAADQNTSDDARKDLYELRTTLKAFVEQYDEEMRKETE